jgi:magnesium chelatase subunit H
VAIVTLDSHLAGAVERAQAEFQGEGTAVRISLHAAAEWDRSPRALEATLGAIAAADIVIATMLFVDDHIQAVLPALHARREQCDAMIGLMSGAEVVRLTRLGQYRMDAPATGPMALLKRLRGKAKPGASSGAGQMKMLRRLPKILKYIPGTAQDVRAYFLTLQYWLAGSDENVSAMIRALIDRYADGPRRSLRGQFKPQPPREYPEVGVYHPAVGIRERAEDLPSSGGALRAPPPAPASARGTAASAAGRGQTGTVGLVLLRSYLLGRDAGHYDGVIAAMEARGLSVIPAFASGLDARPAIERFFTRRGRPTVDAVVNLTGFSLVGGPAYNDSGAAIDTMTGLGVPLFAAQPVEFQTIEAWGSRPQGLLPLEATMMVAIPELDGATAPTLFGGRSEATGTACTGCHRGCVHGMAATSRAMRSCPERAEMLASRVARLVALRRSARAERRLGIVLFNFPPNAGAAGTAAFLGVWESLHATLARLSAEGYDTGALPETSDALREAVLGGNADRYGSDANVETRIPTDSHVRHERWLKEIEGAWGPAPGRHQADGHGIHVLGKRFGNVFVGLQPSMGIDGDPMRLMFEGRHTPTHAMSAFYRWLSADFGAHAVLHFGTHGSLEFMPGKQAGMSAACWPDRLIGDLPNYYLYAANNPSEGLIAKRRAAATLVSYLTPPVAKAGLYRGLADLKALLERWRGCLDAGERAELETLIRDGAAALDLDAADLTTLSARLYDYEAALIPAGLHVLGSAPTGAERRELLEAAAAADATTDLDALSAALDRNDELGALTAALDGGFVPPAPGGDILTNPQVLPTGRNLHGIDPFKMPTRFAVVQGTKAADALLARHPVTPRAIAMVLWGTDNLKSEGAQLAQALALIGARPRHDGYGRLCGAELIPLSELGRARVDVTVTLSGIFRDLLPMQTRMLAEAAWLAASADEPEHLNPVRAHALAAAAAHGISLETAALRVFSNAEGQYGANVNLLIEGGAWTDPEELADCFERQKGFAYGRSGGPQPQRALMAEQLGRIDFAYQNLESIETGITDLDQYVDTLGGIARLSAKAKGGEAAPVYIVDGTVGAPRVRTLAEQVDLETRTRTLNPKWFEGMLKHGFEGVRHIEMHVTNTLGWSATAGAVPAHLYQKISETFVLDAEMRARLAQLNPKASMRVSGRLLEACERDLWRPDAETLAALRAAHDDLEDRLEGVRTQ